MTRTPRTAAALLAFITLCCACTSSTSVASHSPSPSPSPSDSAATSPSEGTGSCPAAAPTASSGTSAPSPPPFTAANLIQNPGGESDTGATDSTPIVTPSIWTTAAGEPDVVRYGASGGFPDATSPGPPDRGSNFFGGGNVACSEMTQKIDLSSRASDIDAGKVTFYLSAWLGGYDGQDDFATLTVTFTPGGSAFTIGPVTQADRQGEIALQQRSTTGSVPSGARSATVLLQSTRFSGTYNDGYADDLTFELSPPS